MSSPIQEEMDRVDKMSEELIEIYVDRILPHLKMTLGLARSRYYDALVYFSYVVKLIKMFGDGNSITIPSDIVESGHGKTFRIDQVKNDDGSMTITLVEIIEEMKPEQ